ncbi:outer membrane beta-barrel protein [Kaarinaea lacus]
MLPKVGFMDIQINDPSPLWSVGLLYGFGLTNRVSLEAETNLGISGGEYEKRDSITGAIIEKGTYNVSTLAAYGVYRYPLWQGGYVKSKLGLLYEKVSRELEQQGKRENSDFGVAGGLGFGALMMNKFTLELEATIIDKDIIFYSLGTHINF